MNEPQPIGACAILLNSQGQILLGKRKNSYKAGMYGLPGGRIEVNEKITTAIAREVFEETGLQGLEFSFVGTVRENQGDYDFIHFIFSANVGDTQPQLSEPEKCEGWEWFEKTTDLSGVLEGHASAIKMFLNNDSLADLVTG